MRFQPRHFSAAAFALSMIVLVVMRSQAGAPPSWESARTQGTVAGFNYVHGGCEPWADFTVAGKSYMALATVAETPCQYTVGQSVGVAYDPADPSKSSVTTGGAFDLPMYVLLLLIVTVIGVGVWSHIRPGRMPMPSRGYTAPPAQTVSAQQVVPDGPVGADGFQRFRDLVTLPPTIRVPPITWATRRSPVFPSGF